jgi:demethylmenaquinone methyltransferase / 2-methoxy-6-polyprenyl-1,4-benzoquinol methylase
MGLYLQRRVYGAMSREQGESKAQFVHAVFEKIAPDYDRMNTLLSFRRHRAWRRFTIQKMNIQPGDTAIDVCCGTCDGAISFAQASQTGRVIGLDFSQKMLSIGQMKLERQGLTEQVALIHGDALQLPFTDHTFDYAMIGFALRNVSDLVHVLGEMKRVVKPGGHVVSLELSKPTWPLFRQIYAFYMGWLLPWLGKLLAGRYEPYRWLPESLRSFPGHQALAHIMKEEVGLIDLQVYRLTGGVAALHIGRKPTEERGVHEGVKENQDRVGND